MQLTLRYHESARRPACAAFLRGTDAGVWLREIGRWGLTAEQLSCYLVPESIRSVQLAGLLVVAKDGATLPADVLEPYGVEAGRLYVPTQATLWPPATPEELADILLWPRQLWHPGIGLVGFEVADELPLAALLDYPAPGPADWGRALPGPAPKAELRQLRVLPPSADEVMQQMQQQVATASLRQLRPADEAHPNPARRLLDGLRRGALRATLAVVGWLQGGGSGPARPTTGTGWKPSGLGLLLLVGMGVGLLRLVYSATSDDTPLAWIVLALMLVITLVIMLKALGGSGQSGSPGGSADYGPSNASRPRSYAEPTGTSAGSEIWPVLAAVGALLLGALLLVWLFSSLGSGSSHFNPFPILLLVGLFRLLMRFGGGSGGGGFRFGSAGGSAGGSAPAGRASGSGRPGLLTRLSGWLGTNLADLERKRNREIERLLRMFDENMQEALKYAIPLGGPYQDRGVAPAGASLGPRSTDFSLSGLGGGGPVDAWDLDHYRDDLRRQYQAAAEQEARAGRYQKAAYIHAHLLGDFAAAARVLEEGGFFREAAALHKEHLRNPAAAAQCLERGGLLLEAAEQYAELQQHEKAGDLYQQLGQPQLAGRHYERATALLLDAQDHPEAARLLADKLQDADRAQAVLLEGWAAPKQPETCLRRYFELAAAAPEADLGARVRAVYQQHTPAPRRLPLLRVLAALTAQFPADAGLRDTSRELAYEVAGTEAAGGNVAPLNMLRHFLPDDRLLTADVSRFTTGRQQRITEALPRQQVPQLDASIEWLHAVAHGAQWLALGLRDNRLHLARANWLGNVEYYSWTTPLPDGVAAWLVADDRHSTRVLVRTTAPTPLVLDPKHLPRNAYFSAGLNVEAPAWLPPWPARVVLLPDDSVGATELHYSQDVTRLLLHRYPGTGQALPTITWNHLPPTETPTFYELLYHDQVLYLNWQPALLELYPDGTWAQNPLATDRPMIHLARSPYAPGLMLAMSGEEQLIMWHPDIEQPRVMSVGGLPLDVGLFFVGPQHLVAAGETEAYLYYLGGEWPQRVQAIEAPDPIVAVLTTGQREQFALLHATGRVSTYGLK